MLLLSLLLYFMYALFQMVCEHHSALVWIPFHMFCMRCALNVVFHLALSLSLGYISCVVLQGACLSTWLTGSLLSIAMPAYTFSSADISFIRDIYICEHRDLLFFLHI